jgi:AraC family transcriptional regulator
MLLANFRSHGCGEGPGNTAPPDAEIAIVVRGSAEGAVTCTVGGSSKSAQPTTGSIWLRPIGMKCDEVCVGPSNLEYLHLYVPGIAFARLADDCNLPEVPGRSMRYRCGMQDELINQIGLSVLSEMMSPTAAGRMLVETSSLLLAARLVQSHLETGLAQPPAASRHRLDETRLRRVLAYIEEHVAEDITVAGLASVACLSIFHFTRAFAAAMGVPPHRYVSGKRLRNAKAMIATGRTSLSAIALDSQFSSQSSFTRAFRRATGMTPAEYRRVSC